MIRTLLTGLLAVGAVCLAVQATLCLRSAEVVEVAFVHRGSAHGSSISLGGGLFLTAGHVWRGGGAHLDCDACGEDGSPLTLVREWPGLDMVLLRADVEMPATPMRCGGVRVGEAVSAEGWPLKMPPQSIFGRVSGTELEDQTLTLEDGGPHTLVRLTYERFQWIHMGIASGMSGGPVLDPGRRLVGMAVVELGPFTGMVPASAICGALG